MLQLCLDMVHAFLDYHLHVDVLYAFVCGSQCRQIERNTRVELEVPFLRKTGLEALELVENASHEYCLLNAPEVGCMLRCHHILCYHHIVYFDWYKPKQADGKYSLRNCKLFDSLAWQTSLMGIRSTGLF